MHKLLELNSKGEMNLPILNDELTSEIRPYQNDSPTSKFRVVFIDDNHEFIKFVTTRA